MKFRRKNWQARIRWFLDKSELFWHSSLYVKLELGALCPAPQNTCTAVLSNQTHCSRLSMGRRSFWAQLFAMFQFFDLNLEFRNTEFDNHLKIIFLSTINAFARSKNFTIDGTLLFIFSFSIFVRFCRESLVPISLREPNWYFEIILYFITKS